MNKSNFIIILDKIRAEIEQAKIYILKTEGGKEIKVSANDVINPDYRNYTSGLNTALQIIDKYCENAIEQLPPVKPQPIGYCKDCKYFEYDSVAKVDEIPLIVAHEICQRWGDGCKTKEDGYCFLFEQRERSDHEST